MRLAVFDLEQSFWEKIEKTVLGPKPDWPVKDVDFYFLFPDPVGGKGQKLPNSGKLDADVVIIFAYRIPELCLMLMNPDVKFIYVQHGYYTLDMARTGAGVVQKRDRVLAYLRMCLQVALRKPLSFPRLTTFIRNVWVKSRGMAGKPAPASPDLALIQGAYWEGWHKSEIGWMDTDYHVKPYLERKEIQPRDEVGAWQYICQSLVEDGRISAGEVQSALADFIAHKKPTKLYLATHPRTDRSVYDDLDCDVAFISDALYALPTVGHYSSLLVYAKQYGLNVEILPFDTHQIPEDFTDIMARDVGDLRAYLSYTTDPSESLIWPYLKERHNL